VFLCEVPSKPAPTSQTEQATSVRPINAFEASYRAQWNDLLRCAKKIRSLAREERAKVGALFIPTSPTWCSLRPNGCSGFCNFDVCATYQKLHPFFDFKCTLEIGNFYRPITKP
jgi:hypothetical protein